MSVNIIGGRLLETSDQLVHFMPDGSAEATMKYRVPWDNLFSYVPQALQPHPVFPALKYYDGEASKEDGKMGNLVNRYRGIWGGNPFAFMQVDGQISTTAEPLETAPVFAGRPGDDPDHTPVTRNDIAVVGNALANNITPPSSVDAQLSGSAAKLYYTKKLRGIDSFFRVGFVMRRHYVSDSVPEYVSQVGYIVDPNDFFPAGAPANAATPPPQDPDQNYLFSGISYRIQGGLVTIDEEYQLSGPGGWDITLYTLP